MPTTKTKRAKATAKACAGTRTQAGASTTQSDLLKGAPSVPRKHQSKTKQTAEYSAGFEACHNLYKTTQVAQLKAKAQAYDQARSLILEQEKATQRVGVLEKKILGVFKIAVKADDDGDDDGDDEPVRTTR